MSTLAEINASLQKLKPTNQFQTLTQEWINVATEGLDPTPPPVTETRACYVTTQPTDAALLALLPTLKAASYNTVKCPAGYTSSLAWMAANGMTGWVSPATWQAGGGWDQSQAQIVSAMQAAWKACPGCVAYLADEPAVGNTSFASQILAMQAALAAAVPGLKSMIAYFDADSVEIYKGINLVAADIYVNKFSFNYQLVTELGEACVAAGIPFTSVIAIASDTTPLPTPAQVSTWAATAKAAGSDGFCVYAWGLGAEQAQYVAAVQALP